MGFVVCYREFASDHSCSSLINLKPLGLSQGIQKLC